MGLDITAISEMVPVEIPEGIKIWSDEYLSALEKIGTKEKTITEAIIEAEKRKQDAKKK